MLEKQALIASYIRRSLFLQEAEKTVKLSDRVGTAEAAASLLRQELSETRESMTNIEKELLQARKESTESEVS